MRRTARHERPLNERSDLGDLDAAMHSVWLHGQWRWLTTQMTTPQKEAALNAVLRHSARIHRTWGFNSPPPLTAAEIAWWRS